MTPIMDMDHRVIRRLVMAFITMTITITQIVGVLITAMFITAHTVIQE
jgi:hypothetical protein